MYLSKLAGGPSWRAGADMCLSKLAENSPPAADRHVTDTHGPGRRVSHRRLEILRTQPAALRLPAEIVDHVPRCIDQRLTLLRIENAVRHERHHLVDEGVELIDRHVHPAAIQAVLSILQLADQ